HVFTTAALALGIAGSAAAAPLPQVVSRGGHHALIVDGAPFLILGGQANNSSNYPAMLPQVWPTIRAVHANTLEIPVAWEQIDPQHTVIMVQVENETGTYDSPRDFSPEANRLFAGPIPAELARRVNKSGTWTQAFGKGADRAFTAWYLARYVDEIATAGQSALNLPMYVKAALGGGFTDTGLGWGGPDWPVMDIWKVGPPHIAIEAPDIYTRDPKEYAAYVDHFARPNNALFVPETGNDLEFARHFWLALGR